MLRPIMAEIAPIEPVDEGSTWPGEDELNRLESTAVGGFRAESTES